MRPKQINETKQNEHQNQPKLNVHDLHQNSVHLKSTQCLVTTCKMFSLIGHIVFKPNRWSDNSTLRTDFLRAYWIMDWTCCVGI